MRKRLSSLVVIFALVFGISFTSVSFGEVASDSQQTNQNKKEHLRSELLIWLEKNEIPLEANAELCLDGYGCINIISLEAAEKIVDHETNRAELSTRKNELNLKVPPQQPPPPDPIPYDPNVCGGVAQYNFFQCYGTVPMSCTAIDTFCYMGHCNQLPVPGLQAVTYEWSWSQWECRSYCGICVPVDMY